MKEDKSKLMNFTMRFGYILGGFWIFKYLFVIFSTQLSALAFVSALFSIGTPFLLFYALVKYKETLPEKKMGYRHGIQFAIMLFFFASILEAAIILLHTIWIDPLYIAHTFERMLTMVRAFGVSEKIVEQFQEQSNVSPFAYAFNAVMSNVLIGILLALFVVPIARGFQFQKK